MKGALWQLLSLARAPRSRLILAAVLGALTVLFGVGLMATAGYLISRASERPAVLSLMVAIVAVRFFGLGRPVVRYAERLRSHDVALRVLGRVRATVYRRLEPLAPTQLDGYRRGDLLSRMVADVDAIQNLYLRGLGAPIVALLAGGAAVGVAGAFLPLAALVLAAGLVAGGVAVPAVGGLMARRAGERQAPARGRLSAELVELARGAPELVVFGRQQDALDRVRDADRALVKVASRGALAVGSADGLGTLITGATVAGVLAVAVSASGHGRLSPVLIAMLALLALASFEAVNPLAAAARELSATMSAGRRVLELTEQEVAVRDPASPAPAPVWPFEIEFEHVRASYPRQPNRVFDHLDLRLGPGEHVALLGPSGAGKTTVVNLLLRFLDPQQGRVMVAGRDLRDYRQEDIRSAIAVAGQDSHLFTASIGDNVRLAKPGASDRDVEQALSRACLWEWVQRLPAGVETLVGEEGRELSGGQRQRIVLARALLADAPVLVLDEPTAHLDPRTAGDLMRDVITAARDTTLLLITHRTEGLDLVDRVVTLDADRGGAP